MKTFKIIITILFFAGLCCIPYVYDNFYSVEEHVVYVDPELEDIVNHWRSELHSRNIDYIVRFNRIDSILVRDTDGAGSFSYGTKTILISPHVLDYSIVAINTVVWHELGHYIFQFGHRDEELDIMNTRLEERHHSIVNWIPMKEVYFKRCRSRLFS